MVRERVDIHGLSRVMESPEKMQALNMHPREIGVLKETPIVRWSQGQSTWDKRYKRTAANVVKQRYQLRVEGKSLIDHALSQGLILPGDNLDHEKEKTSSNSHNVGRIPQEDRRWGPLDLDSESPPPTAIAKRQDTVSETSKKYAAGPTDCPIIDLIA